MSENQAAELPRRSSLRTAKAKGGQEEAAPQPVGMEAVLRLFQEFRADDARKEETRREEERLREEQRRLDDQRRREEEAARRQQEGERAAQVQQTILAMLAAQTEREETRRVQDAERQRLEEERRQQELVLKLQEDERRRQEERARREREAEQRKQDEERREADRKTALRQRDTPRMSAMTEDADIEDFIANFEIHMEEIQMEADRWMSYLRPLLNNKARDALAMLSVNGQRDYQTARNRILDFCGIRQERLGDQFWNATRPKGDSYTRALTRWSRLLTRYIEGAETIAEVKDRILKEKLLQTLPSAAAAHVRDKDPDTAARAAILADRFFEDRHSYPDHPRWQKKFFTQKQTGSTDTQPTKYEDSTPPGPVKTASPTPLKMPSEKAKGIQCYNCKEYGHISARCPKKVMMIEESMTATFDSKNNKPNMIEGQIEGVVYKDMLLDSGADGTVVHRRVVPKDAYTGKRRWAVGVTGKPKECPTARVKFQFGEHETTLEVLVMEPKFSALLGWDLPFFPSLMKEVVDKAVASQISVQAVSTRAQAQKVAIQEKQNEADTASSGATTTPLELKEDVEELPNFSDDMFLPPRPEKQKQTKSQKRERAKCFQSTLLAEDGMEKVGTEQLKVAQKQDETLQDLWTQAQSDKDSTFMVEDGVLLHVSTNKQDETFTQIVVPARYRSWIFKLAHRAPMAGHFGTKKMQEKILQQFYWPKLGADVSRWCRECQECQKGNKTLQKKAELIPLPVIDQPFKRVAMDIVGPLRRTTTGFKYILTFMDFATRYAEAVPLKKIDAETVADALCQIFTRLGIPDEILSDQGSNFMSTLMAAVFNLLQVKHIRTSPYHPQTDGMLERFHATLKAMLRKTCPASKEWDRWLPYACFAYRDTPHSATGFSPFELMFGRQVRGPLTIVKEQWTGKEKTPESIVSFVLRLQEKLLETAEIAKETEAKSKAASKKWYDQKARDRHFEVGTQVLALIPDGQDKLSAQWHGPYTILEQVSPVSYRIETPERKKKTRQFHVNMLKKWTTPTNVMNVMVAQEAEDDDEGELQLYMLDTELVGETVINANLSPQQNDELQQLLGEVTATLSNTPGLTDMAEHTIPTGDTRPIHQHPYRVPMAWQGQVRQEIQSMLKLGVIEPSDSPWASPIVPVKKKDGTIRLCIDYRKLNSVTSDDTYQMPRVDELIENLGDAVYITTLDLTKGYYQVPVAEMDREKTAFTTPFGKYRFRAMPFGLKGAPTTFQRMMDRILGDCCKYAAAYLDDVIIFSRDWDSHLKHIRDVFDRLSRAGLTVKRKKCQFAMRECSYLGHIVGCGLVQPETAKVEAIRDFKVPQTKKDVRAFLGLVGYYRKFIPNFAEISACLTDLTKNIAPAKVRWQPQHQTAFNKLKLSLQKEPILVCPDYTKPFWLQTDAADKGIGAVLSQRDNTGTDHPVAFYSRKLLPREIKYSTTEKECLAIVNSLKHYAVYLLGRQFVIQTDHGALKFLHTMKNSNGRLTRWALALQPFSFTVMHRPGKIHGNADGLSRQSWGEDTERTDDVSPEEGEGSVRDTPLTVT